MSRKKNARKNNTRKNNAAKITNAKMVAAVATTGDSISIDEASTQEVKPASKPNRTKLGKANKFKPMGWVFACYLAWVAVASPWFDTGVSNHAFVKSYVVGIGSSLFFLWILWKHRAQTLIDWCINPLKIALLLFVIFASLSVFWTVNVDFFVTKWFLLLIGVFAFVTAADLRINHTNLLRFSWSVMWLGFVISGIGVGQFLFDAFSITQAAVPSSTFGNRNMACQPVIMVLPLSLFVLFSKQVKGAKVWLLSVFVITMLSFVFYTASRNAWLSIGTELLFIGGYFLISRAKITQWIDWDKIKRNAVIFTVLATLLMTNLTSSGFSTDFMLAKKVDDNVARSERSIEDPESPRFRIWRVAGTMVADSPILGTGLGSWYHNEVQGGFGTKDVQAFQRVHNDLLELAIETGVIGVALFLLAVFFAIYSVIRINKNASSEIGGFFSLVLICFIGSFVNLQFSFPYQMSVPFLLAGWYFGLISTQLDHTVPSKVISFHIPKPAKQAFLGFAFLFCAVMSAIYLQWINAYTSLDKIHANGKFQRLPGVLDTWFYHLDMPTMLAGMSGYYVGQRQFQRVVDVDRQILEYWDANSYALYRQAYALMQIGKYDLASKSIDKLLEQKVAAMDEKIHVLKLFIFEKSERTSKLGGTLDNILAQLDQGMEFSETSYQQVLALIAKNPPLQSVAPDFYAKYAATYSPEDCTIQSKLATHYYNAGRYQEALGQVEVALGLNCDETMRKSLVEYKDMAQKQLATPTSTNQ